MGTNYYLERKTTPCVTCGKPDIEDSRIHIGKSSGGWVWLWRGYRGDVSADELCLTTVEEWFAFLATQVGLGAEIVDEYDHETTLTDFLRLVMGKRDEPRRNSESRYGGLAVPAGQDDINFHEFS